MNDSNFKPDSTSGEQLPANESVTDSTKETVEKQKPVHLTRRDMYSVLTGVMLKTAYDWTSAKSDKSHQLNGPNPPNPETIIRETLAGNSEFYKKILSCLQY